MMLFYCPDNANNKGQLSPDESKHCIKVLRHQKGDCINVTDGTGSIYEAVIVHPHSEKCIVEIIRMINSQVQPAHTLHIAIAPTKNTNRFEWFLEKSVEIGIDTITPLFCQRSERRVLKTDRFEKLIVSSMKQAFLALKPRLNEPVEYNRFLDQTENSKAMKFIGHCENIKRKWLKDVYVKGSDAIVLIGPEGDFTPDEIQQAIQYGFIPIALSKNRLRTETAGIVACHTIHLINEDETL